MISTDHSRPIVRAGDMDGLDNVYSDGGDLITYSGEEILRAAQGWDLDVVSPWRRVLPKTIFSGFGGKTSSRLYITTERIVLIRDIDVWREVKGELTPLGLPAAAAKEIHLKQLKASGARQFCEIWPRELRLVRKKSRERRWSWLELRLLGSDRRQYGITLWKSDEVDPETLTLIKSRFVR